MRNYLSIYLPSRHALATLGSTIDEAVKRGWFIQFHIDANRKGDGLRQGDLTRWDAVKRWAGPAYKGMTLGLARDARVRVGVSQWFDNILRPPIERQVTCYVSEWHKALHKQTQPLWVEWIDKQPVVGWAIADHRALIGQALLPWSVPGGHAILFTMKRRVPEPWRHSLKGRLWYWEKVQEAKHIAAEHGLPLVIKTRAKHGDPFWLRGIGDACVYPLTSMQLLAHATLAFHFNSGAGLEARLYPKVKVVNWPVPQPHLDTLPGQTAIYPHAYTVPLAEVIGYDDVKCGRRVMDVVESEYSDGRQPGGMR